MSLRGLKIMGETRISSSSVRPGLTPALELQVVVWHVDGEVVLLHHQVPLLTNTVVTLSNTQRETRARRYI